MQETFLVLSCTNKAHEIERKYSAWLTSFHNAMQHEGWMLNLFGPSWLQTGIVYHYTTRCSHVVQGSQTMAPTKIAKIEDPHVQYLYDTQNVFHMCAAHCGPVIHHVITNTGSARCEH